RSGRRHSGSDGYYPDSLCRAFDRSNGLTAAVFPTLQWLPSNCFLINHPVLDDIEFSLVNKSQLVALETEFHDLVTPKKEAQNRKLGKYDRSPWS
ncbi:hypothetical protein HAX54_039881, partial [Datura stramonium]|nr:hypothetical protein [Datura stramonium]